MTWIAFQAWAMYFLGGCTIKPAGKTAIGYAGRRAGGIYKTCEIKELQDSGRWESNPHSQLGRLVLYH